MKKHKYISNINLAALESHCIVMTEKTFSRTASGKSWRSKPDNVITQKISAEHYYNYCDSIPFFKNFGGSERATFGYTCAGYLVTEIASISPDYTTKIVRKFYIEYSESTAKNRFNL